jgi:hypothetical protein
MDFSSGRSFTDPLSNTTAISPVIVRRDMGAVLQGRLPDVALSSFIHEFTHHWCMASLFGDTLALIQLRATRMVLSHIIRDEIAPLDDAVEDLRWNAFDQMIRFDTALAVMRPILEGLALFAEFDAAPGDTDLILPTSSWIFRAFCLDPNDKGVPTQSFNDAVRLKLLLARTSRANLERKESVLAEPISAIRDGYLASYLFMKDLWSEAGSADPRYHDRDFFVEAIKRWFLDDLALISHLLDDDTRDLSAANAITDYFTSRLSELISGGFPSLADRIIEGLAHAPDMPGGSVDYEVGIVRFESEAEMSHDRSMAVSLGGRRLRTTMRELLSAHEDDPVAYLLATFMAQRTILHLSSLDVDVTISETGRFVCRLEGELIAAGPTQHFGVDNIPVGQQRGVVALHMVPYAGVTTLSITVDSTPIAIRSLSSETAITEEMAKYVLDADLAVRTSRTLSGVVEGFILEDSFIATVLEVVREGVSEMQRGLFVERVFTRVPEDLRDDARTQFDFAGLGGALGGDREILRLLTWLSMLGSMGVSLEAADPLYREGSWFHRQIGSLAEGIGRIQALGMERIGDPLLFVSNGTFWSAI